MSGGGSYGGGGGGGMGDEATDCAGLVFTTTLNSPDLDVLTTLETEDVLNLRLDGRRVLAVTEEGGMAGSVTHSRLPDLIRCMGDGMDYVAVVQTVTGASCTVQIRPEAA